MKKPTFEFNFPKKSDIITKDLPFGNLIAVSFFVNILVLILPIIFRSHLPPEIPLLYGMAEGENQLASVNLLILPALLSMLIIFINSILTKFVVKDEFIKKSLMITAVAATFFTTITTIKIIMLVGSF